MVIAKPIGSVATSSSSQQNYPGGYLNPRTVEPEMAHCWCGEIWDAWPRCSHLKRRWSLNQYWFPGLIFTVVKFAGESGHLGSNLNCWTTMSWAMIVRLWFVFQMFLFCGMFRSFFSFPSCFFLFVPVFFISFQFFSFRFCYFCFFPIFSFRSSFLRFVPFFFRFVGLSLFFFIVSVTVFFVSFVFSR